MEAGLIEPGDTGAVSTDMLVLHHVGYVVADIPRTVERAQARGLRLLPDAPSTNRLGQQVLYFDPGTTNGVLIHLSQLPAQPNTVGFRRGVQVDKIIHAGYLVRNAEEAAAWYVDKFDGVHVGGRAMRVTATMNWIPRMAWRAWTTGDRRQVWTCSRSSISTRWSGS